MRYTIIAVSGGSKTGKAKLDKRFATAIAAKDYAESLNTQATKHYAAPSSSERANPTTSPT